MPSTAGAGPGADRDRAGGQPFQTERVQAGGDSDHVGDRVERADLVEVDVLRVDPVHRRLGPGQPGERVQRGVPDRARQRNQQRPDVGPGTAGDALVCPYVDLDRADPVALHGGYP